MLAGSCVLWLLCYVAGFTAVSGSRSGWRLAATDCAGCYGADREPGHSTAASAPPATTRVTAARHGQGSLHITGTHSLYYVLLII